MPTDPKQIRALRQKAKKLLVEAPENLALTSVKDLQGLVHSLSVYQIELEMQNEELRRSHEQLEQSRSEYAELYDFAPVGYLTFDKKGLITRANLTACGLLGVERSLLFKKPLTLFIDPESQDMFHLHKRQVFETTTAQTCRLVLKRKDGTRIDAQMESIAVHVNGQPLVNAIVTDVTERRRAETALQESESRLKPALTSSHMGHAEEALQRSERRYRSLFDNMLDGFAYCRMLFDDQMRPMDFEYIEVNEAFERLTGLKNVVGRKVSEVIPGIREAHPELFESYGRVALTGRPERFDIEFTPLEAWLSISVYSTERGYFEAVFDDITARKKTEEMTRRLASFPELNPNPILEVNASGEVTFCNPATRAALTMLGMNEEDCNAFVPGDLSAILAAWDGQTEATVSREVGIGGRVFDEAIQFIPQFNVTRIYGRDITARKKVEGALAASQGRLSVIVDSIVDGFYAIDRAWRFIHVNDAAIGYFGKTRHEVIGHTLFDVFPNARGTVFDTQLSHALESGESVHFEAPSTFADRMVEMHAYPGHGSVTVLFRDITARKKAETLLRDSEERFRSMFDRHKAIMLLIEPETGAIVDANIAATGYYGYARDELCSMRIQDINQLPPEQTARQRRKAAKEQANRFIFPHRLAGGAIRWVEVYSTPFEAQGKTLLFSVIHDITERREAEEALKQAHGELEKRVRERTAELQEAYDKLVEEGKERQQLEARLRQAHKMEAVGTLAGGIAHDFNNILAAIIGFSEIAQEKTPEGSPARRHMERVFTAGIRGRDLVKQILAFSRQAEQAKLPVKLSPIVKEALGMVRASLPSTIDIRMNLPSNIGFVLCDSIQIQQIVLNLCTNAAHAMRGRGGSISIDLADFGFSAAEDAPEATMSPGSYAKLSVQDTGVGMSPETIEHIFDPFFTTKPAGEGTGLGLSVVHGIVTSHGGTITVSSEPGLGSTFTVYLPRLIEERSGDAGVGGGSMPRGYERILFIDDEEGLAAMGYEMLTDLGYRVTSKTGAREALALFRLNPYAFDLVITDQTMPEITGKELVREVLAIRADMPVIMCTGFSTLVDADTAVAAGIKAFAMKPLTKSEIAKTIRKALDE